MPLNTDTEVDSVKRVRDQNNDLDAPANESQQQETNSLLSTVKDRLTSIRDTVATESTLSTVVDRLTSIRDIFRNKSELKTATYTTNGTNPEQLPTHAIADGGSVVVTGLRGNTGSVYVGDDSAQPVTLSSPKDAFSAKVDNVDRVWIRTPNSGDGVGVTWEA
jgi:hypothetical protein